ncbi:rhamnulokinase [Paenibacillus gansuensis]|uniref:Rhamnulokinase family protein n=1 Tax=Paenibacillus gansuensis TaxID=306542 RepID=A0ABW5PC88_9BACL
MSILAYDLGASSGRAIIGRLNGSRIVTEEIHRFPNEPVQASGRLHWDILRLYHEMKQGLLKAKAAGEIPSSLAVDSWAVDFGLIGNTGELLGNPYHYRDRRTEGVMERVTGRIGKSEIFNRTGIQFLPFNTIYQLAAMKEQHSPLLQEAHRFLMIPDLLRYFLTGEMLNEFSNATTTQLYNPSTGSWDSELLSGIGIPSSIFGQAVQPGTAAGTLLPSVCTELGVPAITVLAVGEHDTASAVVAVPSESASFAYLSCGTWSLLGTEVDQPVITARSLELNFTNEGGAGNKYRLLKNIMGLWILQELQREWAREGKTQSFADLVETARTAPSFSVFIDPDDPMFLAPGAMTTRIQEFCTRTGQKRPETIGQYVRCVMESLALQYRYVYELTEELSGRSFQGLHMVGGGIHNELLCQWTSDAIGKPVWAGPAEGSAIGNLAVQWIASGEFSGLQEARRTIRESYGVKTYEPCGGEAWEEAFQRFRQLSVHR